jgi:hypothetical protein
MVTAAATMGACDFVVRRDDLHQSTFFDAPDPSTFAPSTGQVLLAVDAFAFTANNITYAVFGDTMRYWSFFPARDGWGTVPVWGFATVARSAHPGIRAGERLYGYLPMSTHTVVQADDVTAGSLNDVSPHRRGLPAIYNQYLRTAGDPGYDPTREAEQMLFRPLFLTGYLIDDFLADASFFGARSVVLSSASSKTAIGLASCLSKRGREHCEVVGLTSGANTDFVEGLGCYSRVVAYDDIGSLPATTPTVFVDMAGDTAVTSTVHRHFGDALRYSCSVGGTHWENLAFGQEFPGPQPVLFFAPAHVDQRIADWGGAGLQKRMGDAWASFLPKVDAWITVERASGRDAIERVYRDTLDGRADPRRGYILSF